MLYQLNRLCSLGFERIISITELLLFALCLVATAQALNKRPRCATKNLGTFSCGEQLALPIIKGRAIIQDLGF